MKFDKYLLLLTTVCIGVLVHRASHVVNNFYNYSILYSDDSIYLSLARSFLSHDYLKLFHPYWAPGYPLATVLFGLLIRNVVAAGIAVSLFTTISLVIVYYFFLKQHLSSALAVAASVSVLAYSQLIVSSLTPLTESLYLFAFWTGLFLGVFSLRDNSKRLALISGSFWGVAVLTRAEGLLGLASFVAAVFMYFMCTKPFSKERAKNIVLLLAVAASFYASYQVVLFGKYGGATTGTKTSALLVLSDVYNFNGSKTSTWAQDIYGIDTFNKDSEFKTSIFKYFKKYWLSMIDALKIRATSGFKLIYSRFISKFELILLPIGLWVLIRNKNADLLLISGTLVMYYVLISTFAPQVEARYLYWTFPFIAMVVFMGLEQILKLRKGLHILGSAAAIIFATFSLWSNEKIYVTFSDKKNLSSIAAESYSSEFNTLINGKTVMLQREGIVFNANIKHIYTPLAANLEELLEYAKLKNVDLLVVAHGQTPPHLTFLYEYPHNYPGLKLVYSGKVLVYQIL